jgi:hypothetical protein
MLISFGVAKKSGLALVEQETYQTIGIRLKQAKELISGPSAKISKDVLKLNRDQLR